VRSQRGLAYSIGSRYNPAPDRGLFEVECVTDAGKTHETLAVIVDLIRKMTEEPPGEEELDRAKEARIQEFVFAFDSPVRIVRQSGWLEYRGYPEGFLETWVDKVRAVTAEEVLEAARGHLRPDGLTVLVVGDTSAFDAPLSDLGEVRTMEVGP
jgi:zinc protease